MMRPRLSALPVAIAAAAILGVSAAQAAAPDVLELMVRLRLRGCDGRSGLAAPLHVNAQLTAAAVSWSRGSPLRQAIADSGYREDRSMGLRASGSPDALGSAISARLCSTLLDRSITDVGLLQRGRDLWVVLAAPFAAPAANAGTAGDILQLVNEARRQGHVCGTVRYAPAGPLRTDASLTRAAQEHANDMLRGDYFEHEGRDGRTPAQRVAATGYRYRRVGENIALGPESAQEVVRGWLASPGHCQNIMDPTFTDIGIAYAVSRTGPPRIYWVQDFAQPP